MTAGFGAAQTTDKTPPGEKLLLECPFLKCLVGTAQKTCNGLFI